MSNDRVYVEGNNGANYVDIKKIDENKFRLKIGDSCVHTINVVFTAEVFSNFITHLVHQVDKPILEIVFDYLAWDENTNKKYLEECKKANL